MAKPFKLYAAIDDSTKQIDVEARTVSNVLVATSGQNRNGWRTNVQGLNLANFAKNPVILWNHDDRSGDPDTVIGVGIATVVGSNLKASMKFESEKTNELAGKVFGKLAEGILKAFSIGIQPTKYHFDDDGTLSIDEADLLEISCVPIGADADALLAAGLDDTKTQIEAMRAALEPIVLPVEIPAVEVAEISTVEVAETRVKKTMDPAILQANLDALVSAFDELTIRASKLESDLEISRNDCIVAEARVKELEASKQVAEIDALFAANATKITPAMAASLKPMGLKDMAWLQSHVETLPIITALAEKPVGKLIALSNHKTWDEMTTAEKTALHKDNPELFNAMRNQSKQS